MFCKKGILRNSAKFTGKHLCQRLFFNKVGEIWYSIFFHRTLLVACHRPTTLLNNIFRHSCFSVNFEKFDSSPFSQNTSGGCFWITKKMLIQAFSDTPNLIYNIHKKTQKIYCKRFEPIPCLFSGNIFDYDWILYGTSHRVSTQTSYLPRFFHISFVDG